MMADDSRALLRHAMQEERRLLLRQIGCQVGGLFLGQIR